MGMPRVENENNKVVPPSCNDGPNLLRMPGAEEDEQLQELLAGWED